MSFDVGDSSYRPANKAAANCNQPIVEAYDFGKPAPPPKNRLMPPPMISPLKPHVTIDQLLQRAEHAGLHLPPVAHASAHRGCPLPDFDDPFFDSAPSNRENLGSASLSQLTNRRNGDRAQTSSSQLANLVHGERVGRQTLSNQLTRLPNGDYLRKANRENSAAQTTSGQLSSEIDGQNRQRTVDVAANERNHMTPSPEHLPPQTEVKSSGTGPFTVSLVNDMVQIPRSGVIPEAPQSRVYSGKNDTQSVQIAIQAPNTNLTNVNVSVSDLVAANGQKIDSSSIDLYREHYVQVTKSSYTANGSPNKPGPPGWYADGLIPFIDPHTGKPPVGARAGMEANGFNLQAGQNQPIWADIKVPKGAAPGDYKTTVTVKSDQGTQQIPLDVHVWNFEVPDKPFLETAFNATGTNDRAVQEQLLDNKISPVATDPATEKQALDKGLTAESVGFYSGAYYGHPQMSPPPSVAAIEAAKNRINPLGDRNLHIYDYSADEVPYNPQMVAWGKNLHAAGVDNLVTMAPVPQLLSDGTGSGKPPRDAAGSRRLTGRLPPCGDLSRSPGPSRSKPLITRRHFYSKRFVETRGLRDLHCFSSSMTCRPCRRRSQGQRTDRRPEPVHERTGGLASPSSSASQPPGQRLHCQLSARRGAKAARPCSCSPLVQTVTRPSSSRPPPQGRSRAVKVVSSVINARWHQSLSVRHSAQTTTAPGPAAHSPYQSPSQPPSVSVFIVHVHLAVSSTASTATAHCPRTCPPQAMLSWRFLVDAHG